MEIVSLEQFKLAYERLSLADQKAVKRAATTLADNTKHPSLRVKRMRTAPGVREASPSRRLRMTFHTEGNTIILRNVGQHDDVLKKP